MKVYLETMGCQMNVLDSESVVPLLRKAGMEMADDARSADVLLYNTCSVRDHAEEKVHSRLGWACRQKADGRKIIIGVLGCMAQRLGEELVKRHKRLDIVCGPGRLENLPDMILAADNGSGPQVTLDPPRSPGPPPRSSGPSPAGPSRQPTNDLDAETARRSREAAGFSDALTDRMYLPGQAYVRIMRGCDKFCTYCIVPFVRGSERSRPPDGIVQEVRRLVDSGVTQVTLLGQTVDSYRFDAGEVTVGLADLLERLDAVAGLRRIRFVTSYPGGFDRAILEAMRDLPGVCEYLHVPAQSGSDRVLRAMNRRYSRGDYDELIDQARHIVPGIGIAGDFIVGFPGETDEDFAASADLVRRSGYKNSYVFKYSPRPGAAAARRMADDVPEEVKKRRNNELLAVQKQVSLAGNRAMIAQTVEVLVEGPSPRAGRQPKPSIPGHTQMVGRTRTDHIVVFDGPENLAGQYMDVKITGAESLTLLGETPG